MGSNLLAILEVTLGGHSSVSLTIPRCKIGTRSWPGQSELTPRIHYVQATESAGDGACTLPLKPYGWSQLKPKTESTSDIVTAKKLIKNVQGLFTFGYISHFASTYYSLVV